jgi:hypothetical protein
MHTNANVSGLLGQSEGEKLKKDLPLITKLESCTQRGFRVKERVK